MSNNSFVDSSTNSHSVTVYGDVQQGAFSPYAAGGYSTSFSGGSIRTPVNQLDFSGDFTVEGWFNKPANGSGGYDGFFGVGTSGSPPMMLEISTDRGIFFYVDGVQIVRHDPGSSYDPNTSEWTYIALVRASGTTKIYLDGVEVASSTTSYTLDFSSSLDDFYIGSYGGTQYWFNGLICDFRMSSSAVYTSDFTVPTERLTVTTDTALLACHLPYVGAVNNSGSVAVTQTGSVSTERDAPYDYLEYDAATHAGSAIFDGTGDYLVVSNGTSGALAGDFTVECWWYPEAYGGAFQFYPSNDLWNSTQSWPSLGINNANEWKVRDGVSGAETLTTQGAYNQWHHIAVVRSGSDVKTYLNGSEVQSWTNSSSLSNVDVVIGGWWDTNFLTTGYISDFRVVNGTAVYTAEFTPPTEPLTAVTNTSLLLPFDDATIIDETGSAVLELKGTPTVSTTDSPYGSGYKSVEFDGSTDYIEVDNDKLEFEGNFTAEAWVKPTAMSGQVLELADGSGIKIQAAAATPSVDTDVTEYWVGGANLTHDLLSTPGGSTIQYDAGSYLYTDFNGGGGSMPRYGFVQIGEWALAETGTVDIDFNGSFMHIDNIDGINTNFRATAFSVQRGTNDVNISNLYLKISGRSNFWLGIKYDGSYGNASNTVTFDNCIFDLSDWTSEQGYLYLNGQSIVFNSNCTVIKNASHGNVLATYTNRGTFTNNGNVYTHTSTEGSALLPLINNLSSEYDVIFHDGSSDLITSSSTYSANAWKHVAVSRRSSDVKLFVDGTSVGSTTSTATFGSDGTMVLGAGASGSDKFTGLISDVRVSSSGVYSSDFTAPSTPLTLNSSEL